MREDAFGLWWHDEVTSLRGGKTTTNRPLAPIPENGWEPPKEFPNLKHAKVLGVDTETKDLELRDNGPGWARDAGEIVGVSLSTNDGHAWYFPVRHTVQTEFNMNPEHVFAYLRDLLAKPMPKVGANLLYDYGWLAEENVFMNGPLYDVQYAEAILYDTARSYALDRIAKKWLGEGKVGEDELYAWAAKSYGGKRNRRDQAGNIWRCPPCLVGPYAEADADLPIRLLEKQWPMLQKENLMPIFDLECRLIRVLYGMRKRGLPISEERSVQALELLGAKRDAALLTLKEGCGFDVEIYQDESLVKLFHHHGLSFPTTKAGNPSFTKDWLAAQEHPVCLQLNEARKYTKATTFVQSSMLDKQVNGKIYPQLHPLRGEKGGAGSGRYSSSDPNGQQVSARDKELAPLIRGCFVPEPGYPQWIKQDLSQIEYRFFAHFSGDRKLIDAYQDPGTDYHAVVSAFLGDLMPRKPIKNFNFMSLYGGGRGKVIKMLQSELSREQIEQLLIDLTGQLPPGDPVKKLADIFIAMYETNFPAAKDSMQRDIDIVTATGEIRTILGRRSTFDLWEPGNHRKGKPLPHDQAMQEYGYPIQRAFAFRGLNRRLQGSAADLMKKGMLDAYEAGVFHKIGFPHIIVHDEFDNSYHPDLREGFLELQRVVENAIPLEVPVYLGAEVGPDWGHVTEIDLNVAH